MKGNIQLFVNGKIETFKPFANKFIMDNIIESWKSEFIKLLPRNDSWEIVALIESDLNSRAKDGYFNNQNAKKKR